MFFIYETRFSPTRPPQSLLKFTSRREIFTFSYRRFELITIFFFFNILNFVCSLKDLHYDTQRHVTLQVSVVHVNVIVRYSRSVNLLLYSPSLFVSTQWGGEGVVCGGGW